MKDNKQQQLYPIADIEDGLKHIELEIEKLMKSTRACLTTCQLQEILDKVDLLLKIEDLVCEKLT